MGERALRCSKASARRFGRPVAPQQRAKGSSYDVCLNVAISAADFLSTKKLGIQKDLYLARRKRTVFA